MIETGIVPTATPHTLGDVRATTGEYLGAGLEDVLLNSPLAILRRATERQAASGGALPDPAAGVYGTVGLPEPVTSQPRPVPMISAEQANRQYGALGLKFEAPVAAGEAELMAETKRRELAASAVFRAARAPSFDGGGLGAGRAALSVATDFLGTALDPINLAVTLLPVVGPAGRAVLAARLGEVGGAAAAGAVEGAIGNALLEPLLAGGAIAEQRDYHWYDSAANIALGGVLGGGLGAVHGYLGRTPPAVQPGGGPSEPRAGGPSPNGPPAPPPGGGPTFGAYAAGWRAAVEQTGYGYAPYERLSDWDRLPAWDRTAPMVRSLELVAPETRRVAGQVATMQWLNGRPIDVEPVLALDGNWRPPLGDPAERLRLLVDQRQAARLLEGPREGRVDPLAAPQASGHFADFEPGELLVDARRFQFKGGGDQAGVTNRLQGVTRWDQRLAGLAIVWQDEAGKLYVVDGHQRHALASRLEKARRSGEPRGIKPLPDNLEFQVSSGGRGLVDVLITDKGRRAHTTSAHYFLTFRTEDGRVTDAFNVSRKYAGLGEALYARAMKAARKRGIELRGSGSEYAERVWKALERRGMARAGTFTPEEGEPYTLWTASASSTPSDIRIHAILLREANGESEGYARALAAFKNIAEGSGTAIDAAKIIRETRKDPKLAADLDSGRLPQLPPTSALVRDADALARLPDQAFALVAAGKVEPAHAAHVTRILSDPKQQIAAVELLAKLGPDTSEQARLIVEQIRAAGFVEGQTVDLFGRQDVAASLMLERAKVLEATARALRKDATVFRTLVERESVATEAGNVLARDANVERLTDDRAALAVLEALANRAGSLSTALNQAARGLAEGKTLRSVTGEFLRAVRLEASALRPRGAAAQGSLGALADLEKLKTADAGDAIGDRAALDRHQAEANDTPRDLFADPAKVAEAEADRVAAEAQQALAADPGLKTELEAAEQAAEDADLFGKAAEALAGCKITGGQ